MMARTSASSARPAGIGDADLVARAKGGDGWARTSLYRRHARKLIGLVTRLLASTTDVEDVVHDAFLAAFERLDTLREPEAFYPWLRQIAVFRVRSILRRRRLQRALGLYYPTEDATLDALASDAMGPTEILELRRSEAVLAAMPVDERIVWMMRHVDGEKVDAIAQACGCSLSTAKRRLRRANERMLRALGRES